VSLFSDSSGGSESGLEVEVSGLEGTLASPIIGMSFRNIAVLLKYYLPSTLTLVSRGLIGDIVGETLFLSQNCS